MRLAFVSPLPPAPTGIADYAADLLALVAPRHEIELFHAQDEVDATRLPAGLPLHPAAELVARHRQRPYDLAVYQMGNGPRPRLPLRPASRACRACWCCTTWCCTTRGRRSSSSPRRCARGARAPRASRARERAEPALEAWRAELEYAYPGAGARLYAAQLGTVGDLLPYAYPLFRIPVEASRAVAVHNRFMAEAIRAEVPGAACCCVPMPAAPRRRWTRVPCARCARGSASTRATSWSASSACSRRRSGRWSWRARWRARRRADARLRLLLVGPVPDRARLESELERLGVRGANRRHRPRAARRARGPHRGRGRGRPPALPHARARPRPRSCACWRRDGRRSCPTSSTRPSCRADAVAARRHGRRGGGARRARC